MVAHVLVTKIEMQLSSTELPPSSLIYLVRLNPFGFYTETLNIWIPFDDARSVSQYGWLSVQAGREVFVQQIGPERVIFAINFSGHCTVVIGDLIDSYCVQSWGTLVDFLHSHLADSSSQLSTLDNILEVYLLYDSLCVSLRAASYGVNLVCLVDKSVREFSIMLAQLDHFFALLFFLLLL